MMFPIGFRLTCQYSSELLKVLDSMKTVFVFDMKDNADTKINSTLLSSYIILLYSW